MSLPEKKDLLNYLDTADKPVAKRELIQALQVSGDERRDFNQYLRKLEKSGDIIRQQGAYSLPGSLPETLIVQVSDISVDADVFARPAEWDSGKAGPPPEIEIVPDKKGHPELAVGDRALVRLNQRDQRTYEAHIIRRLSVKENRIVGMIANTKSGPVLRPADKKVRQDYVIEDNDTKGAKDGDMVTAEIQPTRGQQRDIVRIIEVIGDSDDPKSISLVAAYEMNLRTEFPQKVIDSCEGLKVPELGKRQDLRSVPLVTIDGADAKDFDDAVFAEPDTDPDNPGGFHIIVAIADVSYYVRPESALNEEAYTRGNSTYFPDRVLPMLPEALSNDLCSLRPDEDRACLAVHMWISSGGKLLRQKFVRGLMRSRARLIYEQVQAAYDGQAAETTKDLMDTIITPLYRAFHILEQARENRGALDLDMPEREILIDDNGEMEGVRQRRRVDAHRLIEEFMILANVAAAHALEEKNAPCMYRVHDKPDGEKLDSARDFLSGFNLNLPKGHGVKPEQLNTVLKQAADLPYRHVVTTVVLRTQSRAHYSPENIGHYGLALKRYAHFTSPIRRYADLLVHRALVRAYDMGPGALSQREDATFDEMAEHISATERASAEAERNAVDRFTAAYLEGQAGAEFEATINGVTRFGLFITLAETGADGLIPIRTLPDDYYIHDEKQHALIGRSSGRVYRLGAQLTARLVEADALTGGAIFEVVGKSGADIPGFQPIRKNKGKGGSKGGPKQGAKDSQKGPPKGKGKGKSKGSPDGSKNKKKGGPKKGKS